MLVVRDMNNNDLKNLYEKYIGFSGGKVPFQYTWKDVLLYHLAIGGKDAIEDCLYEEKGFNVIPTFASTCCYNIINNCKNNGKTKYASFDYLKEEMRRFLTSEKKYVWLDFDHEIIFHKPLNPYGDCIYYEDKIVDIYDRFYSGIVVKNQVNIFDGSGNLFAENIGSTSFLWGGNYGGKKYPASGVLLPKTEPNVFVDDEILNNQHLIYRLLGDTSKMHVDDDYARKHGMDRATIHGFCTMGIACRHLGKIYTQGAMGRIKRIKVQFKNIAYPGIKIRTEIWDVERNKKVFRMINRDTGKVILDRGEFEYD